MKRLSSLLLGSLVLATSSLGAADPASVDMVVQLTSFDAASGVLAGNIVGGTPTEFLRTGTTTYVAGDILKLPPGPCRGLTAVWNHAVKKGAPPFVFDVLLFDMSLAKCDALVAITATPASTNGAAPMIAIKPGH